MVCRHFCVGSAELHPDSGAAVGEKMRTALVIRVLSCLFVCMSTAGAQVTFPPLNSSPWLGQEMLGPALFQFNVVVPSTAASGNQAISATYNGQTTQAGTLLAVNSQ